MADQETAAAEDRVDNKGHRSTSNRWLGGIIRAGLDCCGCSPTMFDMTVRYCRLALGHSERVASRHASPAVTATQFCADLNQMEESLAAPHGLQVRHQAMLPRIIVLVELLPVAHTY